MLKQALLEDWDGAFLDLHNLFAMRRGKLSIAAMPSFAGNQLPLVLLQYRHRYPNVNITVQDVIAESVVAMVRNGPVELEAHQLATIGRMVATGLGVSAVPALCAAQMEEMGAVCRPLVEPSISSRRVGLLTRQRYPLSAATEAMVVLLKESYDCFNSE